MSPKIKVLPEDVAKMIAAGEVVERPASVVKELVENSIDAESTRISVEVKGGGVRLIRVSDDGQGISEEDLPLAFERFATSKLSSIDDLLSLSTLGFRGEALPSIAAVSRVKLSTKREEELVGSSIRLEGGRVLEVSKVGRPKGTTVEVFDLFFNVPARRKFLKSTSTELRRIVEEITGFAIAYPSISFRLVHNGEEIYNLPRTELMEERLGFLFGPDFLSQMIHLNLEKGGISLQGYLGKLEALRSSRSDQFIFVNGRRIHSRMINHALYQGYEPFRKERHPPFLLFLSLNSSHLDINVHPTKREVRFANEKFLYELLLRGVIESLKGEVSSSVREEYPILERERERILVKEGVQEAFLSQWGIIPELKEPEEAVALEVPAIVLWNLHNTYIFAQVKGGMVIIDQHAAQERIIYEEVMGRPKKAESQHLLFPLTLELTPGEWITLEEFFPFFEEMGFILKKFGKRTIVVEAIPATFRRLQEGNIIREILRELAEAGKFPKDPYELLATVFACKSAVKAGDPLTIEEMNYLVDRLFATEVPYSCPHGRPTLIKITLEELERRFGRT